MFFRLETDGVRTPIELRNSFAGPARSMCWIIGGAPSLAALPCEEIARTPAARFGINLSGAGLIRPTIWTSYDPTARFHRSIYLDSSILKLVSARRALDLIPGTTFKVCDAPNLLFFERAAGRGFHDFPGQCADAGTAGIVDWQDSLVQAIELAWYLGFRDLVMIGCDMQVRPEPVHVQLAARHGVAYHPGELLRDFYQRCEARGLSREMIEETAASQPYHFDETKPLAAAIQTDWHYFRVTQYLRLARRSMALAGLDLISATPDSRLNDFFPYRPVGEVIDEIHRRVGDPRTETCRGKYSAPPPPSGLLMRDFKPHGWSEDRRPAPERPITPTVAAADPQGRRQRLQAAMDDLPEVEVPLAEIG